MILNPMVGNGVSKRIGRARALAHMSNKLFVGNLSFNTTENALQDAFAAFGTVLETNLMVDRITGRPRGFGFVSMSRSAEAETAIEERPPGGSGGRGRGRY